LLVNFITAIENEFDFYYQEYLMHLDPSTSLGLDEDSIHSFSIGDLVFGKG